MSRAFGMAWSMVKAENGEGPPGPPYEPDEPRRSTPFGQGPMPGPGKWNRPPYEPEEGGIADVHPDLIRALLHIPAQNPPFDPMDHEGSHTGVPPAPPYRWQDKGDIPDRLGDLTPTEGGPRVMPGEKWKPVDFDDEPPRRSPFDRIPNPWTDSTGGGDFSEQLKNRARQALMDEGDNDPDGELNTNFDPDIEMREGEPPSEKKPPKDEKKPPKDEKKKPPKDDEDE